MLAPWSVAELTDELARLSATARRAVPRKDWKTVQACAGEILRRNAESAEGHFLAGLVEKTAQHPARAAAAFARALELDPSRYDAAVELADQHSIGRRNAEAAALLGQYSPRLRNSPRYLDLAGTVYTQIGMAEQAWPLYEQANQLQPDIPLFQANLAACAVYLGRIAEARVLYSRLLERNPRHQRNHYHLARLGRARDRTHVEQMQAVLEATRLPPDKNVFLYYAIAKELEDLGEWEESFRYYKMAGDAVTSVAHYDVAEDIELIDKIIEVCNAEWLARERTGLRADDAGRTPVFIVGLPRTGTTLTERILSSHSRIQSIGETQFLQMVLRQVSGVPGIEAMTPAMVEAAARQDIRQVAAGYVEAVRYRLGDEPLFIEKLPFNFLHLGFIAKAFPGAHIVHLRRNPMDACFSMYKQVFTWAYKFSYSLDALGRYYVAHDRLARHWQTLLGDRLIELDYEALVEEQETQTRRLLDKMDLVFERACLEFDKNPAASATASSVQVREKIHTRSVMRWKHFEKQLQPLRQILESAGIRVE
jgi:tetratricopeptide (TPR) repeat protein